MAETGREYPARPLIGVGAVVLSTKGVVLIQRGKGADAGAAFGAGASGTVFGARGSSSFFSRATAVCATAFFVTSLTLAYLSSQNSAAPSSVIEDPVEIEGEAEAIDAELPAIDSDEAIEQGDADMPAIEIPEANGDEPTTTPDSE